MTRRDPRYVAPPCSMVCDRLTQALRDPRLIEDGADLLNRRYDPVKEPD